VRPDGSTWHFVDYTPSGSLIDQTTLFGNADTWARGQAWGVYGFTMAYANTGDARLLAAAEKTADWWLANVPADDVPYWDFNAAGIPNEPRDASAAAITASALLDLARLEPDPARAAHYLAAGRATLQSLMAPRYSGVATQGLLTDSVYNRQQDTQFGLATVWGDYYFEEALLRLRWFAPTGAAIAVSVASASTDAADAPKVLDSDPSSVWTPGADGDWVQLALPSGVVVHAVSVALPSGAAASASLEVETSTDGVTWTTATRALSSGQVSTPETYTFKPCPADYLRLVVHSSTAGPSVAIGQVTVY
jgi:unsaturated chondroitin disaccharide hydrolase